MGCGASCDMAVLSHSNKLQVQCDNLTVHLARDCRHANLLHPLQSELLLLDLLLLLSLEASCSSCLLLLQPLALICDVSCLCLLLLHNHLQRLKHAALLTAHSRHSTIGN